MMIANSDQHILIYGGSFDPIHQGHLQTALALQKHLNVDNIVFLPCKTPLLKRDTYATSAQRVAMLQLALQAYPQFTIDLREINRATPSYMVDTLQSFRADYGPSISLILILGLDTFLQLPAWHTWQKIIQLANILVLPRLLQEQQTLSDELKNLILNCETKDKSEFLTQPHGKIYYFNSEHYYDVSSTQIRHAIAHGENIDDKIPTCVHEYIKLNGLYL